MPPANVECFSDRLALDLTSLPLSRLLERDLPFGHVDS
uniref:Uncharacterized protein n=1 Tax=Rhizophora mucronata TaxID=61149 RepID=A0A2P2P850_RHIMU